MTKAAKRAPRYAFRVWVSDDERGHIEAFATQLGMPVSAYLRALGLGYQPLGKIDLEAVKSLSEAIADQARLGNLLRLWLADDVKLAAFDREKSATVIGQVTDMIRDNQAVLRETIARIRRSASPTRSRLATREQPA